MVELGRGVNLRSMVKRSLIRGRVKMWWQRAGQGPGGKGRDQDRSRGQVTIVAKLDSPVS
jgi:hypothetical protein